MKRKHIDAARETRLWIGQVIVPVTTLAVTTVELCRTPELRQAIADKYVKATKAIKSKFKKEEAE